MKLENIKVALAYESPTNPRGSEFEGPAFDDLVASVKEKGVLVPVIARPKQKGKQQFEIVAGNRRFRAAKTVGLEEIPARVEEMTDEQAREVQIIENLQREGMHPLDEGEACMKLIKISADIKVIAAKLGKSEGYVQNRIMICNLADEVKKAYREGELNDGQALEISRLSPQGDQQKAATYVKNGQQWGKLVSVKDLKRWIEETFFDELAFQPWLKNQEAMKAVGLCHECPKETNSLFGEVKEGACTTVRCHRRKMKKYIDWMKEKTPGLVLVSTEEWGRHKAGIICVYDYKKVAKEAKGAVPALVVEGKGRGKMIHVKVTKDTPKSQMTPEQKKADEEKEKKEKELQEKRRATELEKESKRMDAMLAKVTWPMKAEHLQPLFEMVLDRQFSGDIAERRKLEGKRGEFGEYDDPDKVLSEFFAKADAKTRLQIIVEMLLEEVCDDSVNKIMKKFN